MLLKKSARVKDCEIVHIVNFGAPMDRRRDGRADAVMLNFSDKSKLFSLMLWPNMNSPCMLWKTFVRVKAVSRR